MDLDFQSFISQLQNSLAAYVEPNFWSQFQAAYREKPLRALRVNMLRAAACTPDKLIGQAADAVEKKDLRKAASDFLNNWPEFQNLKNLWRPVPWAQDGFYVPEEAADFIGKCQAYKLGLFYLQESSAMLPANILSATANDKVADYCAAPGGKSGKIAADLSGSGCLISNDISLSRAKILLRNLNEAGVWHNSVLNADLEELARLLPDYFDKIILDVPCSGEGMIRKDKKALAARLAKDVNEFSRLQYRLLNLAWSTLKAGGRLVYSTCTFNVQENEAVINEFLEKHKEATILPIKPEISQAAGIRPAFAYAHNSALTAGLRIFPQDGYGEGHFAVLLKKNTGCNLDDLTGSPISSKPVYAPFVTVVDLNKKNIISAKKRQPAANLKLTRDSSLQLNYQQITDLLQKFSTAYLSPELAAAYCQLWSRYPYFKLIGDSLEWLIDLPEIQPAGVKKQKEHKSLHVLSEGIWLGQIKAFKNGCKFVPSHNFALLLHSNQTVYEVKTTLADGIYDRILQGQSLTIDMIQPFYSQRNDLELKNSIYALLTVEGYGACWLQITADTVKSLYPRNWLQ